MLGMQDSMPTQICENCAETSPTDMCRDGICCLDPSDIHVLQASGLQLQFWCCSFRCCVTLK